MFHTTFNMLSLHHLSLICGLLIVAGVTFNFVITNKMYMDFQNYISKEYVIDETIDEMCKFSLEDSERERLLSMPHHRSHGAKNSTLKVLLPNEELQKIIKVTLSLIHI